MQIQYSMVTKLCGDGY